LNNASDMLFKNIKGKISKEEIKRTSVVPAIGLHYNIKAQISKEEIIKRTSVVPEICSANPVLPAPSSPVLSKKAE